MRATSPSGEDLALRLRTTVFREKMHDLGHTTPQARARAIGLHRTTVHSAEKGEIAPGERFIIGVLRAFPEHRFEDFFEIAPARERTAA